MCCVSYGPSHDSPGGKIDGHNVGQSLMSEQLQVDFGAAEGPGEVQPRGNGTGLGTSHRPLHPRQVGR